LAGPASFMQSVALLNLHWPTFVIAGQVLQMSVEKFDQRPGLQDSGSPGLWDSGAGLVNDL